MPGSGPTVIQQTSNVQRSQCNKYQVPNQCCFAAGPSVRTLGHQNATIRQPSDVYSTPAAVTSSRQFVWSTGSSGRVKGGGEGSCRKDSVKNNLQCRFNAGSQL